VFDQADTHIEIDQTLRQLTLQTTGDPTVQISLANWYETATANNGLAVTFNGLLTTQESNGSESLIFQYAEFILQRTKNKEEKTHTSITQT